MQPVKAPENMQPVKARQNKHLALVKHVTRVLQPIKLRDLMEYVTCAETSKVKNF